ncbi:Chromatin structure-remodeling complex subunit rsc7 [Yarrowia lipolytica]|nr:Chromatin structure-remodeling complex subunit rsc7 [Yarrowia lipolytica]
MALEKTLQLPAMMVLSELTPEGDEFVVSEFDPEGEKKIDLDGRPQGGREFRMNTFKLPGRGSKLFMMATECAKELNFRDSYLLFNKNKSLYKMIASQKDKEALIALGLLPYSFRSRVIGIITARSIYRQFGARAIVDGKRVTDDYWEAAAIEQGFTESDPVIMDRRGQITHVYNQEVYGTPNPPNLPKAQKRKEKPPAGPTPVPTQPATRPSLSSTMPRISSGGMPGAPNTANTLHPMAGQPPPGASAAASAANSLQTPAHVHPHVYAQLQQSQQMMGGAGPVVPAAPAILATDSSNQPINNAAAAAAQVETANLKNLLLSTYMPGTSIRGSLDYQQGNISLASKYNIASIDFFHDYKAPEIEASYSALEYNRYLDGQRKFRKDMWTNFWQIKSAGELPSKPNLGVLDANEVYATSQTQMMKRKQESVEQEAVIVNTKKRRGRGGILSTSTAATSLDTHSGSSSVAPDEAEPTFQDVSEELTQSQPPPQIRKLPMGVSKDEYLEQMYAQEQRAQAAAQGQVTAGGPGQPGVPGMPLGAMQDKSPKSRFKRAMPGPGGMPMVPGQGIPDHLMQQLPLDHQLNQQRQIAATGMGGAPMVPQQLRHMAQPGGMPMPPQQFQGQPQVNGGGWRGQNFM